MRLTLPPRLCRFCAGLILARAVALREGRMKRVTELEEELRRHQCGARS
ncbi:hypothetical protein ACFP1Z_09090 [Streptomyces gamaensis]|uniref:Uncharacterized protein n=1 Tax=Streptomyces gamaensis TaxID=1763542 RepID=A0ABW0Z1R8_9ACTN